MHSKLRAFLSTLFIPCNDEAPNHVSPSQIERFRGWSVKGRKTGCIGKWGYAYLDKVEKTSNPDADIGKLTHEHLEAWGQHRVMPDDSHGPASLATAIILNEPIPDPSTPGLSNEGDIKFRLAAFPDVDIIGKCDYRVRKPSTVRMKGKEGRTLTKVVIVGDHKTIGNITYKKLESELRGTSDVDPGDPQVAVYGLAMLYEMLTNPDMADARYLMLRWHFVEKKNAPDHKTETTEFVIDLDSEDVLTEVERWYRLLAFDVKLMRELKHQARELKEVTDVEEEKIWITQVLIPREMLNTSACKAFKGCPHNFICNKRPKIVFEPPSELVLIAQQERFFTMTTDKKETAQEKIARMKAAKLKEEAAAAASASTKEKEGPGGSGAAAKLAAKRAGGSTSTEEEKEKEKPAPVAEKEKPAPVAEKPKAAETASTKAAAAVVAATVSTGAAIDLLKAAAKAALDEGNYPLAAGCSMLLGNLPLPPK